MANKNTELTNKTYTRLKAGLTKNKNRLGDVSQAITSRYQKLSRQRILAVFGLMTLLTLGVLGAANDPNNQNNSSSDWGIWSTITNVLGWTDSKESANSSEMMSSTNGTLQLSKEYIYAGSRMLAIEDYGLSNGSSPTPTPTASPTASPTPTGTPTATPTPATGSYNAVNDFSAANNPAGAWSYGSKATLSSTFVAYTNHGQPYGAGVDAWSNNPNGNCCLDVRKNTTGSTYSYGSVTQPANQLNLHPGANGEKSVIRWTAPSAGNYAIQGLFQGIDQAGTTTDVHILHNNTEIWADNLSGFGAQSAYNLSLSVSTGDVIEFIVGYGGNNTYNNDSTGLAATITPSSSNNPTPTPTPTLTPTPANAANAVNDFSATTNPAGAWSYGQKPTLTGTFSAFATLKHPFGPSMDSWVLNQNSDCCASVTKNTTGAVLSSSSITQPADQLNLHPGANGEKSVVRWMAPSAGTYTVQGLFQGIDIAGSTTDVHVLHNNTEIWLNAISGFGAQATFSLAVTVNAGDVIEFAVGYGNNNSYNNDSTGLSATITPSGSNSTAGLSEDVQPAGGLWESLVTVLTQRY